MKGIRAFMELEEGVLLQNWRSELEDVLLWVLLHN